MGARTCLVLAQEDAEASPVDQFVGEVLDHAGLGAPLLPAAAEVRALALLHFCPGRACREHAREAPQPLGEAFFYPQETARAAGAL
jgi:hypothetical protein